MTQGHYPRHSMSMYASKDDMLTAVMKENEELHAQLVEESARTAEQKLRADQISKQHDMQCAMHKEAVERAMRAEAELEAVGARGVQALRKQAAAQKAVELEVDDLIDRLLNAQQDLNFAANVHMDQCIASASTLLDEVEIALRTLAATHPTQQGLADLRWQIVHDHIGGEYIAGRACFVVQIPALPGANIMRGSVAEHFTKAVDAIAAQAKQGETK